uniref:Uncharacterized protein n=1 Tax=Anguilla anguilla TaxID=7936 RepID=A0A0E9QLV5_ANGAN
MLFIISSHQKRPAYQHYEKLPLGTPRR